VKIAQREPVMITRADNRGHKRFFSLKLKTNRCAPPLARRPRAGEIGSSARRIASLVEPRNVEIAPSRRRLATPKCGEICPRATRFSNSSTIPVRCSGDSSLSH